MAEYMDLIPIFLSLKKNKDPKPKPKQKVKSKLKIKLKPKIKIEHEQKLQSKPEPKQEQKIEIKQEVKKEELPSGIRHVEEKHNLIASKAIGIDRRDQEIKCVKLWSAVVVKALMDGCLPLINGRPCRHAFSGIDFLFNPEKSDHVFDVLDLDADHFRVSLIDRLYDKKNGLFEQWVKPSERNAFKQNYEWWWKNKSIENKYYFDLSKDERENDDGIR